VGKIADAFVEIGADDGRFSQSVDRLASVMRPLTDNAKAFAGAAEAVSERTDGVFSSIVGGAAQAVRAYAMVTTAARVYRFAAKASGVINPFAGIKENALSILTAGFGALTTKVGLSVTGLLGFAAAAAVVVASMSAIASGVSRASALQEQSDFSRIVLGTEGFKEATDNANRLSWSFGVLRKESLQTTTQAAAMAKNMGLSRNEAAKLGVQVTRLAADLSSAANTSMADASTAINALFRGEGDPIERYAVSIREAAIETEALASGLARSKGEIDENVKFQARWNLLIKQTADSQGNLSQTSGSYANVMRNMRGQFAEASTQIGEAFLPVAGNLARVLLTAATGVRGLATAAKYALTPMSFLSQQLNNAYDALSRLTGLKPAEYTLFSANAAENEAKRIKRFEEEFARDQQDRAREAADLKLKAERGLLTDKDKESIYAKTRDEYSKMASETEAVSKKMLDLQSKEADLVKEKKKAEEDYQRAIAKSLDEERKKIAELDQAATRDRQRKLEDMELARKRQAEERAAALMFSGAGEFADNRFLAATKGSAEDKNRMEDFNREEARKREDMLRRQEEIRISEEAKRKELTDENRLTNDGLKTETDRVVRALEKIYEKFNMRMN